MNVDSFSSKLQRTLEKIGKENGLAPEKSQDPSDELMHEFYVAQTGEALFKKRKEKALDGLTSNDKTREDIARVVALTKKADAKETATLVTGQNFTLNLETRKPVRKVSLDKVAAYLQAKSGWSADAVATMMAACTETQEPAKSFRANPVRG